VTGASAPWPVEVVRVTRLSAADVAALRALDASFTSDALLAVRRTTTGGFSVREQRADPPVIKHYRLGAELRAGTAPPWDRLFLARAGGTVVGMAATVFEAWNARQRLEELHVTPAARRRGLARELVGRVLETARDNGARELWVETQNINVPAIRAYRRLGFTVTGLDLTRYAPPHDTEVAVFLSRPVP
jgi:ribosomal protein S18 acetylase RimI-like enzyme